MAGDLARDRIRLADRTTLRLGGPARAWSEPTTEAELVEVVTRADRSGEPVLVLGGGSNVVVADEGFDGRVVAICTRGIAVDRVTVDRDADAVEVEVAAGEPWDALVVRAVELGWSGIECLSGIPGLAGASPIQNIGAYGQEVSAVVTGVRALDRAAGRVVGIARAACGFGYRTSRFKAEPGRFVVLSVRLRLPVDPRSAPVRYADLATTLGIDAGARVPLADARAAVLEVRSSKGMVLDPADRDTWSAGSFFLNPVLSPAAFEAVRDRARSMLGHDAEPPAYAGPAGAVKTSAAWLIERAGFARGYGNDRVRLSTKHTLSITNRGGATTADVLALAREIHAGVLAAFGVALEPEPVLVGTGPLA